MLMIFFSEAGVGLSVGETAHTAENNSTTLNKIFFAQLGMLGTRGLLEHIFIIKDSYLGFHIFLFSNVIAMKLCIIWAYQLPLTGTFYSSNV